MNISTYLTAPLQLDKICRACLAEKNDMKPLYSAYLDKMFNSFVLIQAKQDDGLPSQICTQCVLQCIDAYAFKQQCEKSDRILREFISPEFQAQLQVSVIHTKIEVDELVHDLNKDMIAYLAAPLQMDKICRACLKEESDKKPLYSAFLDKMINCFVLIQAQTDDGLPSQICAQCILLCFDAYAFKQQCEKSDQMLREFQAQLQGSVTLIYTKIEVDKRCEVDQYAELADDFNNDAIESKSDFCIDSDAELDQKTIKLFDEENNKENNEQQGSEFALRAVKQLVVRLDSHRAAKQPSTPITEHKCEKCVAIFSTKDDLKVHLAKHPKQNKHVCSVCSRAFSKLFHLKRHANIHLAKKPYQCDQCDMSFLDNFNLTLHKNKHTDVPKEFTGKPYLCSVCGKKCEKINKYIKHMKSHSGDYLLSCNCCNEQFSQAKTLNIHVRSHKGELAFPCDMCEERFSNAYNLKMHVRMHMGEKSFKCRICKKGFTRLYYLKLHIATHASVKRFICKTCGKSYFAFYELKKHQRVHTGEKPYKCETCGKCFLHKCSRDMHMLIHTGVKSFICETCKKAFFTSQALKVHLRVHTGEKPYKCTTCGKCFAGSQHLKIHIRTHTGIMTHICRICEKGFNGSGNLRQHLITHTGEKKFKCDVCGMKFTLSSNRNRHMKKCTQPI